MILITGANGQLGSCFRQLSEKFPETSFLFTNSDTLNITDKRAVRRFFAQHAVSYCINCAAYTAVDKAQEEPLRARKVNIAGVRNLAETCAAGNIPLIHFSSDYVYHSRQNTPFIETDPVSPKGVYARTKLAGERAAQRTNPRTMIIRTSWVYAATGHNFVKTMLRLARERGQVRVVFDQIGTPTYAPDLAEAVLNIVQQVENKTVAVEALAGVWHYSNEGVASWYDFAHAIFEIKNIPCRLHPIETKDFPTPAHRPPFSVLNKAKIKAAFGIAIPHWRESLRNCLALLD